MADKGGTIRYPMWWNQDQHWQILHQMGYLLGVSSLRWRTTKAWGTGLTVTYAAWFAKIADTLSNTHGRITASRTFVTVQIRPPIAEDVKAFSVFCWQSMHWVLYWRMSRYWESGCARSSHFRLSSSAIWLMGSHSTCRFGYIHSSPRLGCHIVGSKWAKAPGSRFTMYCWADGWHMRVYFMSFFLL